MSEVAQMIAVFGENKKLDRVVIARPRHCPSWAETPASGCEAKRMPTSKPEHTGRFGCRTRLIVCAIITHIIGCKSSKENSSKLRA